MRLPIDPAQWGVTVVQRLCAQVPAIESYVQLAHLIDQDPEGNGFGLIPLGGGPAMAPMGQGAPAPGAMGASPQAGGMAQAGAPPQAQQAQPGAQQGVPPGAQAPAQPGQPQQPGVVAQDPNQAQAMQGAPAQGTGIPQQQVPAAAPMPGAMPQTGCFIPFVVRAFELKPLDLMIVVEDGEDRFCNLSEANALMAVGGVGMGTPINTEPVGVEDDAPLDLMPPNHNFMGMGNRSAGRPDVMTQTSKVKFGSDTKDNVERMLKMANERDPELAMYLVERYQAQLEKLAADTTPKGRGIVVMDYKAGAYDVSINGEKRATLDEIDSATFLRKLGCLDKVASVLRGEMILVDNRVETEKVAAAFSPNVTGYKEVHTPGDFNAKTDNRIDVEGWYKVGPSKAKVFRTNYFDGKPCTFMLGVTPHGYLFARHLTGKPTHAPDSVHLRQWYQPCSLKQGDMAFFIRDVSGEASIPFLVKGSTKLPNGDVKVIVEPIIGDVPTMTLHFGNNQHPYMIGKSEVALPNKGYSIFKLSPKRLGEMDMIESDRPVHVRIYKGGGAYSIREDNHDAYHGLNRGMLATLFIERYGFEPDLATAQVKLVDTYASHSFDAMPIEAPRSHSPVFHSGAADMAIRIIHMMKGAAEMNPAGDNGPNRTSQAPDGASGPGGPNVPGSDPNAAPPPPGQAAVNPSFGAAIMPDIPGMQEIVDLLTSYATGNYAPDELSQIFSDLIDQLGEVQNLCGRVLLLVRLGKIEFITEQEAKRLLEESDKFRASLTNADMLLKGVGMVV
jgi:hypothetical protein